MPGAIGDPNMDAPDLSMFLTQGMQGLQTPLTAPPADGVSSVSGVSGSSEKGMNVFKDTQSTATEGVGGAEGYQAPSSTPTLSPVVNIPPTANDIPSQRPDQVQEGFMHLVSQLPPTLRTQLMKDMAKPPEQRTPDLVALENSLMNRAKTSDWAQQINGAKPIPPGGPIAGAEQPLPGFAPKSVTPQGIVVPATIGTVGKVDPKTMTPAEMAATLRANGLNTIENQVKVIQGTINSLPDNDPNKPLLMEFLKFVGEILDEAKKFLHEMATADADVTRKSTLAMKSIQLDKLHKQIESIEKQAAQRAKQAQTSVIMKIMGPIVAIAMVALVIISGGSAMAIAIAVVLAYIAVLASMSSVVDNFFKAFVGVIQEVFKAMGLPKDVCDALTAILIVILIIIAIVALRSVASMDIGGMVAGQIGEEAAAASTKFAATMVALEAGIMLVQNTNCISMIIKPFLKACGVDEKTAEIIAMVAQLIVMLAMAIAGGVSIYKAATAVSKSVAGSMGKELQTAAETIEIATNAVQVIIQSYSAVAHFQMADLARFKAHLDAMITQMDSTQDVTKQFLKQLDLSTKSLTDLVAFYSDSFTQIITSMQQVLNEATST